VGNEEYNGASVGAFVRYEWARGELSLSGGFASDQPWDHPWANVSSSSAPYATVNWLMRF
jgi:hypothetical protein